MVKTRHLYKQVGVHKMYLPVFLPFLSVAATEHHGVLVRGVYDGLLIRHAALRILHGVSVEL